MPQGGLVRPPHRGRPRWGGPKRAPAGGARAGARPLIMKRGPPADDGCVKTEIGPPTGDCNVKTEIDFGCYIVIIGLSGQQRPRPSPLLCRAFGPGPDEPRSRPATAWDEPPVGPRTGSKGRGFVSPFPSFLV